MRYNMRKVLLIDDQIKHAENLLLTIEAILVNAVKQHWVGVPGIDEMQINYFLVFDDTGNLSGQGKESLNLLKKRMNSYLAKKADDPGYVQIKYHFVPMLYDKDMTDNSTKLVGKVQECLANDPDPFCILLDMLLFNKKDEQFIREIEDSRLADPCSQIVSHQIYRHFQNNCLTYSAYPPQTIVDKWCRIAGDPVQPYELSIIANGKAINIPFLRALLDKLGITEGGRR